ncbi:50S ribosomal protein L10 [Ureaplasma canigenitalium]|uniref:50S ribosomal protein L10 n=1 Tax=Ureaplasma canigenitalium TaxID=42092 RepID=UPI0004E24453|nr:50S ribosomal protein L10 [Ureaplasma canigenitalium]
MQKQKESVVKKQALVEHMAEVFKSAKSFVVFEYHKLTAANILALRNTLHESNSKMFVLKNNISKRAFEKAGIKGFENSLSGPNAFAVGFDDEVAAIKAVHGIQKEFDFVPIKGAYLENKYIDVKQVASIANIPGRDGLYSMLLSCFTAPLRNVLYGLKAVAEKKGA